MLYYSWFSKAHEKLPVVYVTAGSNILDADYSLKINTETTTERSIQRTAKNQIQLQS